MEIIRVNITVPTVVSTIRYKTVDGKMFEYEQDAINWEHKISSQKIIDDMTVKFLPDVSILRYPTSWRYITCTKELECLLSNYDNFYKLYYGTPAVEEWVGICERREAKECHIYTLTYVKEKIQDLLKIINKIMENKK